MEQKPKPLWYYPVLIVSTLVGAWAGDTIYNYVHDAWNYRLVDTQLSEVNTDMNKGLPKMIDKITRLDGIQTPGHHVVVYRYTLILDPGLSLDFKKFEEKLRPKIVTTYRTDENMKYDRDFGVSLVYDYYDTGGHKVAEITVGPNDLK